MKTIKTLLFTPTAEDQLKKIRSNKNLERQAKAIKKTLQLMRQDLRHPGLRTHEYSSYTGDNGEKIFEAYVKNKTPGAYRVFWHYGPNKLGNKGEVVEHVITIYAITPHP